MNSRLKQVKKWWNIPDILTLFFTFTPFAFGLFYEYAACACAVFMIILLLYLADRKKRFSLWINAASLAMLALLAGYLVSQLWAVDSGMALLGFFKFLPAALFWIILMQLDPEEHGRLFLTVPVSGVAMTLLSFPTRWIPALKPYFYASGRLGGFFQYSNSFALFLLLGIIILAFQKQRRGLCLTGILLLLSGIFATGSRTVFVLTVLVFLWLCLTHKRLRVPLLLLLAACVAAALLFVAITGNQDTIGRFLTISLESSTLMGRLLYYRDVLPVILKHPFGLGYMGYYYAQGSFQTGIYVTKFVHNELLQFAVDVGWIPALLFAFSLLRRLFSKKTPAMQRLLLFVICAHAMLDFDLQFLSIFFVLFLTMDPEEGKEIVWRWKKMNRTAVFLPVGALAAVCLYLGAALFAGYRKNDALAARLYPGYTPSQLVLLAGAQTPQEAQARADKILSRNESIALVLDCKALVSATQGDFETMVQYKRQALDCAPYVLTEYLDYFQLLRRAMETCQKQGDAPRAALYAKRLLEIPDLLDAVKARTSPLAWKIQDQPELDLPEEYAAYLNSLQTSDVR